MSRRLILAVAAAVTPAAVVACQAGVRELSVSLPDAAVDATGPADAPDDSNVDVDGGGADGAWTALPLSTSPVRLALDDAYVYWTTLPVTANGGELARISKTGGAPERLADQLPKANGLVANGDYLYVTSGQNFGDGVVARYAKADGGKLVLADGLSAPLGVAVDDAAVYWVDLGDGGIVEVTGRVVRAPKDGGAQSELARGLLAPTGVAVDDAGVYFTTLGLSECDGGPNQTGTVERVARDGGQHVTLARDQDCPGPLVLHDSRVFWVNESFGAGTVNVVEKTGGPITVLAKDQPIPSGLTTDGTRVYWINSTVLDGTVLSCVVSECAATLAPLSSRELSPIAIDNDGTSLFWADLGVPPRQAGSLHRAALLGKP